MTSEYSSHSWAIPNKKFGLIVSFLALLLGPVFFPTLHLYYFSPYLITTYYRYSRYTALWHAVGCGIVVDLFSSTPFFGLSAMNYSLVTLVLYGQRRNFFEEKISTLPVMTFFFSFLSTLLSPLLHFFCGRMVLLQGAWVLSDLVCMSCLDGLYALLFFSLPFQLTNRIRKMRLFTRRRE